MSSIYSISLQYIAGDQNLNHRNKVYHVRYKAVDSTQLCSNTQMFSIFASEQLRTVVQSLCRCYHRSCGMSILCITEQRRVLLWVSEHPVIFVFLRKLHRKRVGYRPLVTLGKILWSYATKSIFPVNTQ